VTRAAFDLGGDGRHDVFGLIAVGEVHEHRVTERGVLALAKLDRDWRPLVARPHRVCGFVPMRLAPYVFMVRKLWIDASCVGIAGCTGSCRPVRRQAV
jgi:hypothetical protein